MRRFIIFLGASIAMSIYPITAMGNPTWCEVFRVRQVPESRHAQMSFGQTCTNNNVEIISITKDGITLKPSWQSYSGFVANSGSGLKTMSASQTCDCDLALGPHEFRFTYKASWSSGSVYNNTFKQVVEIQEPASTVHQDAQSNGIKDAAPLDSATKDAMPWEIPEPEEIQGLDCIATCKARGPGIALPASSSSDASDTAVDASVASAGDSAAKALPEPGTASTKHNASGCSVGRSKDVGALPFLLFAAAIGVWLINRRLS
jgi:hypothetical protein